MTLEAIKTINDAEEAAKRQKQEALHESKRLIAETEENGRRAVAEATAKAAAELAHIKKEAVELATKQAHDLARNTENRKAAMMVKADSRIERAIDLVVERIVKN